MNIKAIDSFIFKQDLRESRLCDPPSDLDELVSLYNETITTGLAKHAPVTTKYVPVFVGKIDQI